METTRKNMDMSKLEGTIEKLHEFVGDDTSELEVTVETAKLAIYYLEYLSEKYESNRLYHKKQNVKKQIAQKLIKQLLSEDELRDIDRQADEAIGNTVQEPTFE